ncbi:hypothetical protein MJ1HA_2101 [Metallosphaera sedula]|nr:hypothetical protein MJ1HA_2101 [Metallosphaera sedula]
MRHGVGSKRLSILTRDLVKIVYLTFEMPRHKG